MTVRPCLYIAYMLIAVTSWSDEVSKKDAAIGGGVGGAVGAAIGAELGDREGAIVGSAVGAAIGTAIATEPSAHKQPVVIEVTPVVVAGHPKTRHCPPGQAKKGRC